MEAKIEKFYFVSLVVFLVFLTGVMTGAASVIVKKTGQAATGWAQAAPDSTNAPVAQVENEKKLAKK